MGQLRTLFAGFDIILFLSALTLTMFGLVTMYSHVGDNAFFDRQILWIFLALVAMCGAMIPD